MMKRKRQVRVVASSYEAFMPAAAIYDCHLKLLCTEFA
jgi:hypothetical protein